MLKRAPTWVAIAVGAYVVGLLLIAGWPSRVDEHVNVYEWWIGRWLLARGFDHGTTYGIIEGGANVLLYLPAGAIFMLVFSAARWWHAVTLGVLASVLLEGLQAVFLPGRTADPGDVVANGLGVALGAGLVVLARAARRARVDSR